MSTSRVESSKPTHQAKNGSFSFVTKEDLQQDSKVITRTTTPQFRTQKVVEPRSKSKVAAKNMIINHKLPGGGNRSISRNYTVVSYIL